MRKIMVTCKQAIVWEASVEVSLQQYLLEKASGEAFILF